MIENKKTIKIILIVILVLVTIILFYVFKNYNNYIDNNVNNNLDQINIYFINQNNNGLEARTKLIERTDILGKIFSILKEFESNSKIINSLENKNKKVEIKSIKLVNDKDIELNFSKEYLNIDPKDEILLRAALVWTLTDIKEIENVRIYVENKELLKENGEEIGNLNRYNVPINPKITKEEVNKVKVKLYFKVKDENKLYPEEREIEISSEQTLEEQVINQLIKGPESKNLQQLVAHDLKLLDVITTNKICYIDFNHEFILKLQHDNNMQELLIYSIVNSLTDLPNDRVGKVQFLVSSEKIKGFSSKLNLSQPFERREDIILK